jgi:hypothetical protein
MPSDSGVTSSSSTSLTSPFSTPAWIAAPIATTSSGLTPLWAPCRSHLLDQPPAPWACGHAADQHHVVDLARGQAGVLDRLRHGVLRRADQVIDLDSNFGAGQLGVQVLRPRSASAVMKGRLISVSFERGELDLRLLRGFLQPLQRHLVLAQVDALLLELVGQIVDDPLVEVVAAEVVSPLVDLTSNTPSPISSTKRRRCRRRGRRPRWCRFFLSRP